MKIINESRRFKTLEEVHDFIKFLEKNKIPHTELIVLFDYVENEEEAGEEAKTEVKDLPEIEEVDKDAIIKELAKENEELKKSGELPSPNKPSFNPFKRKTPKVVNIKETKEQ